MAVSELTIRYLGPKGDGIHQGPKGRIYVERAVPGDRIKARVRRDEAGLFRGEIVEIVEPSAERQIPPCPHYDVCGNCTLQHVGEGFYRSWKTGMVKDAFRKEGLRPQRWLDTVFLGGHNRRRATFSALKVRGRIVMGYYRRRSRQISDIDSCLVADPRILAIREAIKPLLPQILMDGKTTDFFVQIAGDAADLVITGPVGRKGRPDGGVRAALNRLMEKTPIVRVGWRGYERDEIEPLLDRGAVTVSFGPLRVALPPAAFLQPTPEGEKALVDAVMAAIPPDGHFADLFSGCGTFSGPLLERGSVDAYESVPAAVKALGRAAAGKPLRVFRRDLFRHPLRRDELNRYDAVVFDPPRAGCEDQAAHLATARVPVLIGVSCNPATLARDAAVLVEGGYELRTVQVVDQFIWSHHVEVVAVLTRAGRGARPMAPKGRKR